MGYTGYAAGDAGTRQARAEQAAFKALALDPKLSDAHGAYGNLLRMTERPGAEDEYKRALELNPNNSIVAHDYAVLLSSQSGYAAVIGPQDGVQFARPLQQAGYATDPMYADKLARIIGGTTLRQALSA